MSEMSSFYGGRSGAAFIIVKRFDGIDIEDSFTNDAYAYSIEYNEYLIVSKEEGGNVQIGDNAYLIKKDATNYNDNFNNNFIWKIHDNDGSAINDGMYLFPSKKAEGMIQFFKKGAFSSSIVNYGEYVLIDTSTNLHNPDHPDNGKVFRRGMDIDSEFAGGEYIGQIVGPAGPVSPIDLTTYTELNKKDSEDNYIYPHENGSYNLLDGNEGIIPGSYLNDDGERVFEDEIKYSWATIKDMHGNVDGCYIGFRFPTLVQEFIAKSIDPYSKRVLVDGQYIDVGLIEPDAEQYDAITGKWLHPYYQKWHIDIPHGYHGIDASNIEIVPTKTMPAGFKADYDGAICYSDDMCRTAVFENGVPKRIRESVDILRDAEFKVGLPSVKIIYNGEYYHVRKADCYMNIIRYKETNYDEHAEGDVTYHEIGSFNDISRITLSENGILTVFYNAIERGVPISQAIRWIDYNRDEGITINDEGSLTVFYNTGESKTFNKVLDWITEITLNENGEFKIIYNNDTVKVGDNEYGNTYKTTLRWINKINVDADGTINFYYNSDPDTPIPLENKIKYISDMYISIGEKEGLGSQKLNVVYNTGETQEIGQPINYIIEACISTPTADRPNIPYSHLFVYYSDPEYRNSFSADKKYTYPSLKNPGEVYTDWVDLGEVRGQSGGLHILKNVESIDELNGLPPERLEINGEIASYAAGWSVTLGESGSSAKTILVYDYNTQEWYSIGTIDSASIEPTNVIISAFTNENKEPMGREADSLKINGIWIAKEYCKYIY